MRSVRGFTLIELMVTVAVLAIVLTIAVPSFSNLIQSSRTNALVNELNGTLQIARSEALKRRKNVIVCRRNEAGTACDNGTDWSNGWLIRQVGGDVIRVWDAQSLTVEADPAAGFTFLPNGAATAGGKLVISPTNCKKNDEKPTVSVTSTGSTGIACKSQ
ncbi:MULTISPECIES: GspH/FimT family pseudopilin [Pseudomonas]|uniref:Type II secretion system protein H n=1 Tax=Pseudomonas luteola TaxID=47886 RepID=A0A2X2CRP5_PSELU|nr:MULTISPECIES: GspH/FimT family pseudopilin [Pseudomonas]ENA33281.1 prepilin-type N-terminal cleavage/methylation domain-containing protein [Pseudomonas sp. HPB0071]MBF8639502.1 GspH/FimT family pseudopilin [Pseudomonas zeshuii]RRW51310.1 prepilin-type N-terminal cleavage/methylation domain-containing protein [Pseudomonas luteola]SHI56223.1 type IV fimbrial biogenesis protein FimT [Pseudomonas zeshuii]SPZ02695.1 prepilin-type N-terminal cleavage/methylation domain-containing protein [Pseudom